MQEISSTRPDRTAILLCSQAGQFRRNPAKLAQFRRLGEASALLCEPASLEKFQEAAERIFVQRPERVIIVGGDGSLMRGISALVRAYGSELLPVLTPIPAGTVNLSASRWGGGGSTLGVFEQTIGSRSSNVVHRPSLKLRLDDEIYVGFTFGTGLVSHFFEQYSQCDVPGKCAAARIFLRTFAGSLFGSSYAKRILSPVSARLTVGDVAMGQLALSLLVCSVFVDVGLGLKPNYRAGSLPGQLHLVASTLPAQKLGPLAVRVLQGKPLRPRPTPPEVIDCMTAKFSLEFEAPTHIVLDGDAIRVTRVSVEPGPNLAIEQSAAR